MWDRLYSLPNYYCGKERKSAELHSGNQQPSQPPELCCQVLAVVRDTWRSSQKCYTMLLLVPTSVSTKPQGQGLRLDRDSFLSPYSRQTLKNSCSICVFLALITPSSLTTAACFCSTAFSSSSNGGEGRLQTKASCLAQHAFILQTI